jgi:TolA-binding protein
MTRLRAALLWLVMPAALALPAAQAAAQGNFEIQVYGSETVAPGTTMVELHSNSAIRGTTRTEDGIRPTQYAVHETLEVTHGWTPWFETGF